MYSVDIDLANIASLAELHQTFKDNLNFPEYYGMNWDAFWDCVNSIDDMPDTLYLTGWQQFGLRFPHEQSLLTELIDGYNKVNDKKIVVKT